RLCSYIHSLSGNVYTNTIFVNRDVLEWYIYRWNNASTTPPDEWDPADPRPAAIRFDAMSQIGHSSPMPKRSSTGGRKDANRLAASIVAQATGEMPLTDDGKNAAAVALGRLGGIKGGAARAAKLLTKRR